MIFSINAPGHLNLNPNIERLLYLFTSVRKIRGHYVNVSVLITFSQKYNIIEVVFPRNYHQFAIKSYVVDVY